MSVGKPLEKPDLAIILLVYRWNVAYPDQPFLPPPRKLKRAKALAERGYLLDAKVKFSPPQPDWAAYQVTAAGIEAYNAAITKEPS